MRLFRRRKSASPEYDGYLKLLRTRKRWHIFWDYLRDYKTSPSAWRYAIQPDYHRRVELAPGLILENIEQHAEPDPAMLVLKLAGHHLFSLRWNRIYLDGRQYKYDGSEITGFDNLDQSAIGIPVKNREGVIQLFIQLDREMRESSDPEVQRLHREFIQPIAEQWGLALEWHKRTSKG